VSESFEIFYCLCFVLRCLVAEKEREYERSLEIFFWVFVFCLV
jgi:hypothetical protein